MARFEFKLPDIGEGIVEGEIVKWLVSEGDVLVEDQPMVEVMTDKATVVIPSPRPGKVLTRHGAEGAVAKVHAPLVTLEVAEGGAQAEAEEPVSVPQAVNAPPVLAAVKTGAPASSEHVLATPVTRRIAREHGVDLRTVVGSGPAGRVLKSDLLQRMEAPTSAPAAAPVAISPAPSPGDRRIPLKGLRRAIAKKMVMSKQNAPHFTFVEECDATELKALRKRLNDRLAASGQATKLSFLPFIAKAVTVALRKFPEVNAQFDEAAQELIVRSEVNLGIAASTPEGLTVPVIRDAGHKSLMDLSNEIGRLGNAAREKHLKQEELTGGTFTISSLGEQGGLFATPIINHPEVAILGVHRMRPTPVVREGVITVRDIMHFSLSFDHRVIDGSVGAAFTYEIIRLLETPELLMLELA